MENFTGIGIEAKRFGRGAQTSTGASATERRLPQLLLKRLDPRRYGGLGNMEPVGRPHDTTAFDNRNKETQVLNLHRVFLWCYIEIIYFPMRDGNRTKAVTLSEQIRNSGGGARTQARKAVAMIAVIFESWPTNAQKYIGMGEALRWHLETMDGFISIERFRGVSDPAKLVALSFWRDEAGVGVWRNNEVHRLIQAKSRQDVFRNYRLRVAVVVRDYGMFERNRRPKIAG